MGELDPIWENRNNQIYIKPITLLRYAEDILRRANEGELIMSIHLCSWCGCPMPLGGEIGVFWNDKPLAFCCHDCYGGWAKENDPFFER